MPVYGVTGTVTGRSALCQRHQVWNHNIWHIPQEQRLSGRPELKCRAKFYCYIHPPWVRVSAQQLLILERNGAY